MSGTRALFGAGQDRRLCVQPDDVLDLPLALVRLRARQINLVDDGNHLEAIVDGQVRIGQRLRLDSLRRVDEQQGAFTRRQ